VEKNVLTTIPQQFVWFASNDFKFWKMKTVDSFALKC